MLTGNASLIPRSAVLVGAIMKQHTALGTQQRAGQAALARQLKSVTNGPSVARLPIATGPIARPGRFNVRIVNHVSNSETRSQSVVLGPQNAQAKPPLAPKPVLVPKPVSADRPVQAPPEGPAKPRTCRLSEDQLRHFARQLAAEAHSMFKEAIEARRAVERRANDGYVRVGEVAPAIAKQCRRSPDTATALRLEGSNGRATLRRQASEVLKDLILASYPAWLCPTHSQFTPDLRTIDARLKAAPHKLLNAGNVPLGYTEHAVNVLNRLGRTDLYVAYIDARNQIASGLGADAQPSFSAGSQRLGRVDVEAHPLTRALAPLFERL